MSFFYPTSAEFIEKFGCESYTDEDGLQISTFNNINIKLVFSVSNMQNSISVKIYQDEVKTFSIYDEGAMRVTIEPPRLYRRLIYLSQAAMPDRVKLS